MSDFLRVDHALFTVLGYPLSGIEFLGTILYLWSVWLIARRRVLTWPVGIVAVLLFLWLFWQIRLYSDAIEQVYYLAASVYGWWTWSRSPRDGGAVAGVRFSGGRSAACVLAATLAVSLLWGAAMTRVHLWWPVLFPEPASFPWLDAATTVMSFTAMGLMAMKRTESWIYWIVVDVVGIGLYYAKEVRFISLLYVVLLVLAARGLRLWTVGFRQGQEWPAVGAVGSAGG